MKRNWRFAIELPCTHEWTQHLHEREAGPGFPIPMFDFTRGLAQQPFRMLVFPKPFNFSRRCFMSGGVEKFVVPLDLHAMTERGWRPEYAEIFLKPNDFRFNEFFQNWIEYCCASFSRDIDVALAGRRVADTHTLIFAPLGVTYRLKLTVDGLRFLTPNDSEIGAQYEFARKCEEKIRKIAKRKLRSVVERFSQEYRELGAAREKLW